MKESVPIQAEPRSHRGSAAAGGLRREGWVPAVVYAEGKPADAVQVRTREFQALLSRHSSEHMILDLSIRGGVRKVLIKEVQHDPLNGRPLHIDFYEVSMTRKLRVDVPIVLRGDPVGVTQGGGMLDHLLRAVEVECLPGDLIEEIVVDVSELSIGRHLCVRDIVLDAGRYTILTSPELAVAAVSAPRVEEEPAAEEAPAEGAAEPEAAPPAKEEGEARES